LQKPPPIPTASYNTASFCSPFQFVYYPISCRCGRKERFNHTDSKRIDSFSEISKVGASEPKNPGTMSNA